MNAMRRICAAMAWAVLAGLGAGCVDAIDNGPRVYALGDIRETVVPRPEVCRAGEYGEKDGRTTHRTRSEVEGSYLHWHRQAWRACLEGLIESKGQKAPTASMVQGWEPETAGCFDGHALAVRQFEAAKARHGLAGALESAGRALKDSPAQ